MREFLELNVFSLAENEEKQVETVLQIMGRENTDCTKRCFSYSQFFERVLLDREGPVCKSLLNCDPMKLSPVQQ